MFELYGLSELLALPQKRRMACRPSRSAETRRNERVVARERGRVRMGVRAREGFLGGNGGGSTCGTSWLMCGTRRGVLLGSGWLWVIGSLALDLAHQRAAGPHELRGLRGLLGCKDQAHDLGSVIPTGSGSRSAPIYRRVNPEPST